ASTDLVVSHVACGERQVRHRRVAYPGAGLRGSGAFAQTRWPPGVRAGSIRGAGLRSEVDVDWSWRQRGNRRAASVAALALVSLAGCAQGSGGTVAASGGHNSAPRPGTAIALPFNLFDVSTVPNKRQAWALAGPHGGPFGFGNYLLHLGGQNWAKVATFARVVHLKGVSAVAAGAAWVWGDEDWPTLRPFLALVSGGVVRRVRAGLLSRVYVSAMASDGAADTWLAGVARDQKGHFRDVVARWDGTSWHQIPAPPGAPTVWPLTTSRPSHPWAVVSPGF